ncbi:MAG TPA: hypothetical protein VNM24_01650, partial [Burkholderiales bacterium]|nr:hypothetical protein [Burkholderiales bacterium]
MMAINDALARGEAAQLSAEDVRAMLESGDAQIGQTDFDGESDFGSDVDIDSLDGEIYISPAGSWKIIKDGTIFFIQFARR